MKIQSIIEELQASSIRLKTVLKAISQELCGLPNFKLIVVKDRKYIKYYKKEMTIDKPTYIKNDNIKEIAKLQKVNYLKLLKACIEKNIAIIDKSIELLKKTTHLEAVFAKLSFEKRSFIEPYKIPLSEHASFVKTNKNYAPRPNLGLKTKAGEKVRSKSELIIADKLYDAGIPYFYEMNTVAGPMLEYHPDFTVVNKVTGKIYYWEHFGMIDDSNYAANFQIKLENLAKAKIYPGDNLIMSFESSKRTLNTDYVDGLIKKYLL